MDSGWQLTAAMTKLVVTSDATKMDGWKVVSEAFSEINRADYYWDVCLELGLSMRQ